MPATAWAIVTSCSRGITDRAQRSPGLAEAAGGDCRATEADAGLAQGNHGTGQQFREPASGR